MDQPDSINVIPGPIRGDLQPLAPHLLFEGAGSLQLGASVALIQSENAPTVRGCQAHINNL
jgi:hypothetical protein